MNPICVRPDHVDMVWPLVEPMIEEACKTSRGRFGPEYWQRFCKHDGQLWIVTDRTDEIRAVAVSMLHEQGSRRICRLRCIAGTGMNEWVGHIRDLEIWAKAHGCDGMEIVSGRGWERVLKPHGYELTHVILEKDLLDG